MATFDSAGRPYRPRFAGKWNEYNIGCLAGSVHLCADSISPDFPPVGSCPDNSEGTPYITNCGVHNVDLSASYGYTAGDNSTYIPAACLYYDEMCKV